MTRWIRRIVLIALGLAVAASVVYAFLPQPIPVDLAFVSRGTLQVTVDDDGKTRIRERYVVSAPLAGRLRRIELKAGDPVTASKTQIAAIEPTAPELLDARARAEAEARVLAAEARLGRAKESLESTLAAMQFAESEHARARKLTERNAISQTELERLALAARQATQEYREARFSEEIARFELEQAKAALILTRGNADDQTGKPGLDFEIESPITGRVLRVFQESATVVTPGTKLVELGDPNNLEIEIDVLSADAVKIHPGDRVLLEHWGGDEPLVGSVRLVEPSAFTKISALGVEEQRVYVIADLVVPPERRASLGDGYRVEARIVIWEGTDVLRVPTSALFRHEEQWAVYRWTDGRAELRLVTIGRRSGLEAEVLDGLEENDRVIVHPSDKIVPGVKVVPREKAESRAVQFFSPAMRIRLSLEREPLPNLPAAPGSPRWRNA